MPRSEHPHKSLRTTNTTMANPSTQNPFTVSLMLLVFCLSLITTAKSDSFSFNLPSFETGLRSILVGDDAKTVDGVLQLTNKDTSGNPTQQSVGLAAYFGPLHLSDAKTGKLADFDTEFSFVVNTHGASLHGDGFTFFLASVDFEFPDNSTGGFLGLFNQETAFNTSLNQVVAVEFDSFANEWDPNFPQSDSPHIGIDINSIRSVATAPWPLDIQQGSIGKARISYQSSAKILSVSVAYPDSSTSPNTAVLSYPVNLGSVLSEWVLIGFSGTTGDLVETHDILSWSFHSFL
ncbi:Legume lectin [Vigna unguiculata]|uniref:Legume lectin n=2 Tax=Vigna unguiculata TaxID=3917 RepID=A0A4D6LQD9_VIGUN|nr:Legume lectin [Vigna unguiculata]